jgi:hypothetical protein
MVSQQTVNALKLYLSSNLLTFNRLRAIGLCKSLTVNAVNFEKVSNS